MASSPFLKSVLQGAQAWLFIEIPHQPLISRDRICSPRRRGDPLGIQQSQVWAKSPTPGQAQPPGAGPQIGLGQPVGPRRLAHLGGRLAPLIAPSPFPAQPPPWRRQRGLQQSDRARAQSAAEGPPSGLVHSRASGHRPLGPCCGKEAAPGAAGPEAAAFVGRSCVLRAQGEGRKGTARRGSRGWGDVGQGRSRGNRSATYGPALAGEALEPTLQSPARPAAPGHSHGCAGLRGPRALGALVAARPGPSRRSCRCLRRPRPPLPAPCRPAPPLAR